MIEIIKKKYSVQQNLWLEAAKDGGSSELNHLFNRFVKNVLSGMEQMTVTEFGF